MAHENNVLARGRGLHRPGKRVQSAREHNHPLGIVERPVLILTDVEVLLAGDPTRHWPKLELIAIVRKKIERVAEQLVDFGLGPEGNVPNRDDEREISLPRLLRLRGLPNPTPHRRAVS